MRGWLLLSLFLVADLSSQPALCAQTQTPVNFARDVQPILQARCILCHGSEVQMGGLRLDQQQSILNGGKSGMPAVVPRRSADSLMIRYVSGIDPKIVMPPTG